MSEAILYSDGACSPNPGRGGWSIIIKSGEKVAKLSGVEENTTNNRMELMGLYVALPHLIRNGVKEVVIYSDSRYIGYGIKGMEKWRKKDDLINGDMWHSIYDQISSTGIKIEIKWVKGHEGDELNNECDKMAVLARQKI